MKNAGTMFWPKFGRLIEIMASTGRLSWDAMKTHIKIHFTIVLCFKTHTRTSFVKCNNSLYDAFCFKTHTKTSIVKWNRFWKETRLIFFKKSIPLYDWRFGVGFEAKRIVKWIIALYDRCFRVGFEAKYNRKVDFNVGFHSISRNTSSKSKLV